MGRYIKDLTKINPLTIDQVEFTEKSDPLFTSPLLLLLNPIYPSVYLDSTSKIFTGKKNNNIVDIKVFHPMTQYQHDRPSWLISENKRWVQIPKDKIKIEFPVLIRVYQSNEAEEAIPCDVLQVIDSDDLRMLALPKGDYKLLINNKKNEKQIIHISVK
jgi:hypothetical protein